MGNVINIVSGKGGTGKTLFTAVLAELLGNAGARVLTIDLDVFVRGLTTLLYFQKNETIKITNAFDLTVSDFFKLRESSVALVDKQTSICRYRSFDVVPSVAKVDEILNFKDIMPNSIDDAENILGKLLGSLSKEYDYIFLDSRAGYDELIAATHKISNFSICVEEDDNISMITSDNLIAQLRNDDRDTPVLRIRNKVRHYDKQRNNPSQGISFIGNIPFDADVMNSFGTSSFWTDIHRSVYKEAVCTAWNNLAKKMELDTQLKYFRVSPLGNSTIEKRISKLSSLNRLAFIYGTVFTFLGAYLVMEGPYFLEMLRYEPMRIYGLGTSLVGLIMVLTSVTNNK